MKARIAAVFHDTRVNGPGLRSVVYFQGCPFRCESCINASLQPFEADTATLLSPQEILDQIVGRGRPPDGVALSGGEPLWQPQAAAELLDLCTRAGIPTLLYTGFTLEEAAQRGLDRVVRSADVAVCGRYVPGMEIDRFPYTASKTMYFWSKTVSAADFDGLPRYEVVLSKGRAVVLGFPRAAELSRMEALLGDTPAGRVYSGHA